MEPPMEQPTMADLSNIPSLPGYTFQKRRRNYGRKKAFEMVGGMRVEHEEGVTFERPRVVRAARVVEPWRSGSLPDSTTRAEFQAAVQVETDVPAWAALDKVVLRFYGYFKEAVVETSSENYRVRYCALHYYLEDDTCQVTEKKVENAGIPQGTLIRRHRLPGPAGGFLTPADLRVGGLLQVYGRTIRLVDCDAFTRDFYDRQGMPQAPAEEAESDPFQAASAARNQKTGERLTVVKRNEGMQQFLEWDGKVCRFYAIQDDLTTPQFERRPFIILYFLADDTVEIREQYPLNCGRDSFPIFFRKGKMTRSSVGVPGPLEPEKHRDEFVNVRDLGNIGSLVMLQGCQFFIYDADPFTRKFFAEELGEPLGECVDVKLPERTVPRPPTPPYTGFGSWDDSMISVLHLLPKQPKKDFNKLFNNEGKILRFTAKFKDPKPEDAERLFVVNFYLFDDTLSIHEPPQRNLGVVTGKFLEKGVHLNQETGRLFAPDDLYPGSCIKVHNRYFKILGMDEYTKKFFDQIDPDEHRFDLTAVLEKLREGMRQQCPLIRDIFRKFDTDHDGVLTLKEFRQALAKYGFKLTDDEVLVIMKHFDSRPDGQVTYNEFCDALLDEDYTTMMMKPKAALKTEFDRSYATQAATRAEERIETEAVRRSVRYMSELIYKQTQTMQKLLKEFAHMTHQNTVSASQIQKALSLYGKDIPLDEVERCVLFVMPESDLEKIPYIEFMKAMVAIYHDMSRIR